METDVLVHVAAACFFALMVLLSAVDAWHAYRRRRSASRLEAWFTRRGVSIRAKVAQRLREAGHRWDGRS